jgi:hypothetical protein
VAPNVRCFWRAINRFGFGYIDFSKILGTVTKILQLDWLDRGCSLPHGDFERPIFGGDTAAEELDD